MNCYKGYCGYESYLDRQRATLDSSTNAPIYNRKWCEAETVMTRIVPSNRPFSMRSASCCWIPTRNYLYSWRLLTALDLGTRSDTGKPNKSPVIGTLPFLRVPQNCPRRYKLMAFDADGDQVRCRYGILRNRECSSCSHPVGFYLDQHSCTLYYNNTHNDTRVFGFELVVEDFPRHPITLSYSDGSYSYKSPLMFRRKRRYINPYTSSWTTNTSTTIPYWWSQTRGSNITSSETTTEATTPWHRRPTKAHPRSWNTRSTTTGQTTTMQHHTTTPRPAPNTMIPTTTNWALWTTRSRHAITRQHRTTTSPTNTPRPTAAMTTTTEPLYLGTLALSKLPLQFSLLVDPDIPSCEEGLYIPRFQHPTPENGQHIYAEVNKEVEIRVKAKATQSIIHDIIMSGPRNSNKHRTTHNEFVIRWIPKPGDIGGHFPLCFAVESGPNPVYQSEMRCVLINVNKKTVEAKVTCYQSSMKVEVEKASLSGIHVENLRVNDASNILCNLQTNSNSTHVVGIIPLNSCGTLLEEDETYLIFKNEITTIDDPDDFITRKHRLELDFECQYPKRGNVTQTFLSHRETFIVWEKGFGRFTYQFEFYPNDRFQSRISPNSYPLEYDLGKRIYMKIEASSSINNTELFVESCRAAPYDNPNVRPTYSIIENGCAVDQTVLMYNTSDQHEFKFSMEAFKFIGLHDQVYISCSVVMCEAGNPYTRCSKGCINTTSNHHYYKREAVIQSANHLVSQGPLRLQRSAESNKTTVMNFNLNLVFIAGCLLAVAGMMAVVMYKAKMSRFTYQRLPTSEN
ncbi:uncharacterized protein LOC130922448 [Corythoichthys intestinalis]|uniref:uncharacterized protein LOC130922448 n=1 Tax=Corythoichthys intestinalis TaxID=161448 RepID=UPI0025A62BB5|nr:uncharacterized protein LOC130922448 [Corythoichthys intestinalis]